MENENYNYDVGFHVVRIKPDTTVADLAMNLDVSGLSCARLAKALYEKGVRLEINDFFVAWRGSQRHLNRFKMYNLNIESMHDGFVRNSDGDFIATYISLIDESEGLGFSDEDNELRRAALHVDVITPILNT